MKCLWLCGVLFLSSSLFGQLGVDDQALPDSASTSKASADNGSGNPFAAQPIRFSPPALAIQSAPSRERTRTADRSFWLTHLFQIAATVADIESTQFGLARGAREANPLFGSHPSRGKQYAISMPLSAAVVGWSYRLKRSAPHSRHWLIPPIVIGTMHTVAVCHNFLTVK
jgi:hypothetical protein